MITIEYEDTDCPICSNKENEMIYKKNTNEISMKGIIEIEMHICICKCCGCVFQQPSPTQKSLEEFYENQSDIIDESDDIRVWYYDMYRYINDNIKGENIEKVLDIGCRRGEMLRLFKNDGKKVWGIEPSEYNANYIRRKFDIEVKIGSFEDSAVENNEYDLILITNVLEHIKNPRDMLNIIYDKLSMGGSLFISIPKLEGCLNQKSYNNVADYFSFQHLHYMTLEHLEHIVNDTGFSIKCSISDENSISMICNKTEIRRENKLINGYVKNLGITNKYLKNRQEFIKTIKLKLKEIQSKDMIIYGGGAHTAQLMKIIDFDKFKLKGICDSDINKQGVSLSGIEIKDIEDIDINEFTHILISSRAYESEIYENLFERFPRKEIIKLYD